MQAVALMGSCSAAAAVCACIAALAVNPSIASESDIYICKVEAAYNLRGGKLERHSLDKYYEGQIFTINRQTGQIQGPIFTSGTWLGRKEVLDYGSDEQSFKLLFVTPPHVQVRLLVVNEFDVGADKGFMLMDNSDSFTGLCHHGQ